MRPSAADVRWMDEARCAGAEFNFVPDVEDTRGLEAVTTRWCNACPVRVECLAYALLYRESGYWAGTMTKERTLLGYARNRIKCPVCGCKALVSASADSKDFQICQSCGVSWTRSSSPGEEHDDQNRTAADQGPEPPGGPGRAPAPAGGGSVRA